MISGIVVIKKDDQSIEFKAKIIKKKKKKIKTQEVEKVDCWRVTAKMCSTQ